ncbi:MAG: hypothetical protein ACQEW8_10790 [Actinomycetota bacterium]
MRILRAATLTGLLVAGTAFLGGCSAHALIWGNDGARVIDVTEQLIGEISVDGGSTLACDDADLQLGTRVDWEGRSAGEPERFTGQFWTEQVPLDPQWSINIEGLPDGATAGDQFPGDVFYRESEDGLCAVDIVWTTLESVG